MTIELPGNIEEQLRNLAAKQGRDVRTIVEEASRLITEGASEVMRMVIARHVLKKYG